MKNLRLILRKLRVFFKKTALFSEKNGAKAVEVHFKAFDSHLEKEVRVEFPAIKMISAVPSVRRV